jgi:hypothetical protein
MAAPGWRAPGRARDVDVHAQRPACGCRRRQVASWPTAWLMTQSVSASMWPDSSASAMNTAGLTGPRCGCTQRASASKPLRRCGSSSNSGWKCTDSWPSPMAWRRSFSSASFSATLLVHRAVEQRHAATAAGLGLVHGQVGVAQHLVDRAVAQVAEGDAHAGARHDLGAVDRQRLAQHVQHALRQAQPDFGVVQRLQQDGELVAAQPRHQVDGPHAGAQALRHFVQQLVAGHVAQAVVDHLEAVQVQEQHRKALLGPAACVPPPLPGVRGSSCGWPGRSGRRGRRCGAGGFRPGGAR